MPLWDVGRRARQRGRGELDLTSSVTELPYAAWDTRSVCSGTKCRRVQILQLLSSLITAGEPGA